MLSRVPLRVVSFRRAYALHPSFPSSIPSSPIWTLQRFHASQAEQYTSHNSYHQENQDPAVDDQPQSRNRRLRYIRRNRSGQQFKEKRANLTVKTLGKPAQVLIFSDAGDDVDHPSPESDLDVVENDGAQESVEPSSQPARSAASIVSWNEEGSEKNITPAERQKAVDAKLEQLRPRPLDSSQPQPTLTRAQFDSLVTEMEESFTALQLNSYYNHYKKFEQEKHPQNLPLIATSDRVDWWPWVPGKERVTYAQKRKKGRVFVANRGLAASMILRSLWNVTVDDEFQFIGHAVCSLQNSSFATLTAGKPSHLDRILKTWNVTGDLHSNVAKSGVVLIGPRRNVLLAYKHIRDAETAIIVVEVPVHQLISRASQNQKHAKHTIPMHALEAIAYNTRTCITGSLEGNAHYRISSVSKSSANTARSALLDFFYEAIKPSPIVICHHRPATSRRLHRIEDSFSANRVLARLSNVFPRVDAISGAQTTETDSESHNHGLDEDLQLWEQVTVKGTVKGTVNRKRISDFLGPGTPLQVASNAEGRGQEPLIRATGYDVALSLGLVLRETTNTDLQKTQPRNMPHWMMMRFNTSTIQNPRQILLQTLEATLSRIRHVVYVKLSPYPQTTLRPGQVSTTLPDIHLGFIITTPDEGPVSVEFEEARIIASKAELYMMVPAATADVRIRKRQLIDVDHQHLMDQEHIDIVLKKLMSDIRNPSFRQDFQPPDDISIRLPRDMVPRHREENEKTSSDAEADTDTDTVQVQYMFLSLESRHEVEFSLDGVPATFSTIDAAGLRPSRTEFSIHTSKFLPYGSSAAPGRSIDIPAFMKSAQSLFDLTMIPLESLNKARDQKRANSAAQRTADRKEREQSTPKENDQDTEKRTKPKTDKRKVKPARKPAGARDNQGSTLRKAKSKGKNAQ